MPEIVDPFDEEAIVSCAYELRVGSEAFVSGDGTNKEILKDGQTIAIPPGQVALIMTKETVKVPSDAIGFLSIKFMVKVRGLINVSGFHVDPGFTGKLIFSMYNAGVQTIHLSEGSRLFMLWFCTLNGPNDDHYNGQHKGQLHLPDNAVTNLAARMPSPFTVEKDMDALRNEVRAKLNDLGTEVRAELHKLSTDLRGEVDKLGNRVAIYNTLAVTVMASLVLRTCSLAPTGSSGDRSPTPTPVMFSPAPITPNQLLIAPPRTPVQTPGLATPTPAPNTPLVTSPARANGTPSLPQRDP